MSVEVLKSNADIQKARRELRGRELSFTSPLWKRFAHKIGISNGIEVGDELKSWDVLRTVHFVEKNVPRNAPILDMGAFASELPCILRKLDYSNLAGVDLNPEIQKMPYADSVRYEISDFMHTSFENETFSAITAISVIEHGFNSQPLLQELSRLLRPRGYFIASFDYWPDKINTDGISIFGMDWRIFSAQEVNTFIREAGEHGLVAPGDINLAASDRAISCAGWDYTFAWLVLQKNGNPSASAKTDF
jgi:SAM-dependent methyltransferase